MTYRRQLENLPEDWCSGGSRKPNARTVDLLQILWVVFGDIPIIIGPSPAGGVALEYWCGKNHAIMMSVDNDLRLTMEMMYGGAYFDVALPVDM